MNQFPLIFHKYKIKKPTAVFYKFIFYSYFIFIFLYRKGAGKKIHFTVVILECFFILNKII